MKNKPKTATELMILHHEINGPFRWEMILNKLLVFVKEIALEGCYRSPGEYPEPGEDGHAPCRSCQAREIIEEIQEK